MAEISISKNSRIAFRNLTLNDSTLAAKLLTQDDLHDVHVKLIDVLIVDFKGAL